MYKVAPKVQTWIYPSRDCPRNYIKVSNNFKLKFKQSFIHTLCYFHYNKYSLLTVELYRDVGAMEGRKDGGGEDKREEGGGDKDRVVGEGEMGENARRGGEWHRHCA